MCRRDVQTGWTVAHGYQNMNGIWNACYKLEQIAARRRWWPDVVDAVAVANQPYTVGGIAHICGLLVRLAPHAQHVVQSGSSSALASGPSLGLTLPSLGGLAQLFNLPKICISGWVCVGLYHWLVQQRFCSEEAC